MHLHPRLPEWFWIALIPTQRASQPSFFVLRCVNTTPLTTRLMAHVASLAKRGVTFTLSSGTVFAFLMFNPDLYLTSLMSSDMTGKALSQKGLSSRRRVELPPFKRNV